MNIYEFDPVQMGAIVAGVTLVVQFIKSGFEKLAGWEDAPEFVRSFAFWWAHGKGPVILSAVVAVLALLPDIIADGVLTWAESRVLLDAIGLAGASNILYWITRWKVPKVTRKLQAESKLRNALRAANGRGTAEMRTD